LKEATTALSPIKRIHAELSEGICPPDEKKILLNSYITELFIKIAAIYHTHIVKSGLVYVRKVLNYIHNNYSKELTLDEIVSPLGISKGYLRKIIKQETGKTVLDIINECRVQRAKQLIANTGMPLIDIAVECGFNNRQNFYYIFKKFTTQNPQTFRKENGANLYNFGAGYKNDMDPDE